MLVGVIQWLCRTRARSQRQTLDANIVNAPRRVPHFPIMSKRCLINIDLQKDFISGSLALKNAPAGHDAEDVIPLINKLSLNSFFDVVVYSLDYHPPNHISFVDNVSLYTTVPKAYQTWAPKESLWSLP